MLPPYLYGFGLASTFTFKIKIKLTIAVQHYKKFWSSKIGTNCHWFRQISSFKPCSSDPLKHLIRINKCKLLKYSTLKMAQKDVP